MPEPPHQEMQRRYQSLSELEKIETPAKKYQDSAKIRFQEHTFLNDYQFKIYKAAMYGLSTYPKKEIYQMPFPQKRKIIKFYNKSQRVLNLWKQQLVNQLFEQLCSIQLNKFPQNPFSTVFDNTKIGVKNFGRRTDELFIPDITFDQLRINRTQIIDKLIKEQVFPANFFQLTHSP